MSADGQLQSMELLQAAGLAQEPAQGSHCLSCPGRAQGTGPSGVPLHMLESLPGSVLRAPTFLTPWSPLPKTEAMLQDSRTLLSACPSLLQCERKALLS